MYAPYPPLPLTALGPPYPYLPPVFNPVATTAATLDLAYEYYLGWRLMLRRTGRVEGGTDTQYASCQLDRGQPNNFIRYMCESSFQDNNQRGEKRCLPSWKWTDDMLEQLGRGSASDADADALLGMVLLTIAGDRVDPVTAAMGLEPSIAARAHTAARRTHGHQAHPWPAYTPTGSRWLRPAPS